MNEIPKVILAAVVGAFNDARPRTCAEVVNDILPDGCAVHGGIVWVGRSLLLSHSCFKCLPMFHVEWLETPGSPLHPCSGSRYSEWFSSMYDSTVSIGTELALFFAAGLVHVLCHPRTRTPEDPARKSCLIRFRRTYFRLTGY